MAASKQDSGGASEAVRRAFEQACLTEIESLKPGNVHMFSGGHGMTAEDFAASARAAGAVIANPGLGVGGRIKAAVEATWAAVSCNTNLGIVLLCAPLIEAAMTAGPRQDLRARLIAVLDGLTRDDAELAFAAIRRADPAGLGDSARHDVRAPARATLLEAMREAAARDLIARQYATGFADVFAIGVPRIADTMKQLGRDPAARRWAATAAHLAFMAAFPDTHVVRKHGAKAAEEVRAEAARLESAFRNCADPASMFDDLLAFDKTLKARGLNPGTSADLTVASLLAADLPDIFRGQTASRRPGPLD